MLGERLVPKSHLAMVEEVIFIDGVGFELGTESIRRGRSTQNHIKYHILQHMFTPLFKS